MCNYAEMTLINRKINVVIIGGAGFIGRNLIAYLSANTNWNIICVDRDAFEPVSNVKFYRKDFSDRDNIDKILTDILPVGKEFTLIYLAGLGDQSRCFDNPEEAIRTNITIMMDVLLSCRNMKLNKFIFPSTGLLYGKNNNKVFTESDEIYVDSIHAASKIAAEKLIEGIACSYKIKCNILRFSNVFGIDSLQNTLIGKLVKNFAENPNNISVWNLDNRNDYIYVDDVSKAVQKVVEHTGGKVFDIYNVSTGLSYSVREIVDIFCDQMNLIDVSLNETNKVNGISDRRLSNNKIHQDLGWQPEYSIEDGIREITKMIAKGYYEK